MAETRLIYGFHAVTAKLRQDPDSVKEIWLAQSRQDGRARDLLRLAQSNAQEVRSIDAARLEGMVGHAHHQGVGWRG